MRIRKVTTRFALVPENWESELSEGFIIQRRSQEVVKGQSARLSLFPHTEEETVSQFSLPPHSQSRKKEKKKTTTPKLFVPDQTLQNEIMADLVEGGTEGHPDAGENYGLRRLSAMGYQIQPPPLPWPPHTSRRSPSPVLSHQDLLQQARGLHAGF